MSGANPHESIEHVLTPFSVPPEFPEILRDLNRAILKAQPNDIIAFCADYFTKKNADESKQAAKPDYIQINESYTMQQSGDAAEEGAEEPDGGEGELVSLPPIEQ